MLKRKLEKQANEPGWEIFMANAQRHPPPRGAQCAESSSTKRQQQSLLTLEIEPQTNEKHTQDMANKKCENHEQKRKKVNNKILAKKLS